MFGLEKMGQLRRAAFPYLRDYELEKGIQFYVAPNSNLWNSSLGRREGEKRKALNNLESTS